MLGHSQSCVGVAAIKHTTLAPLAHLPPLLTWLECSVLSIPSLATSLGLGTLHWHTQVPLSIRNAPTRLMKDSGYSKGYVYPPDHGYVRGSRADFLPPSLHDTRFFDEGDVEAPVALAFAPQYVQLIAIRPVTCRLNINSC